MGLKREFQPQSGAGCGIRTHVGCPKRFSRPPRYDRFDNPAHKLLVYYTPSTPDCQDHFAKSLRRKKIFFLLYFNAVYKILETVGGVSVRQGDSYSLDVQKTRRAVIVRGQRAVEGIIGVG